jgi:ribokinase
MQLEVPTPVVSRAATIARDHGVPVVLNAAPARPLPPELLARVDYLIVNETEAALLSGRSPAEPEEAARILMQTGPRSVIVTLGERGALYAAGNDIVSVPGFKVSAVDTTAAGDAFIGAFTSALTSGNRLGDAVRWANAAGALATTRLGAQPSLPTRDAVASFLREQAG